MLNRIWVRNIIRNLTSTNGLVVYNRNLFSSSWHCMAFMLNLGKGVINMTVVVKKVPKILRGFVKLIFGIKD